MGSAKIVLMLLIIMVGTYLFFMEQYPSHFSVSQFEAFKISYNKLYASSAEQVYRYHIFNKNIVKIQKHNEAPQNKYSLGITQFTDLTQQQFITIHLREYSFPNPLVIDQEKIITDVNIDWVAEGKVSRVKDQKNCASFWAFATTSSIQSLYRIKKNDNIELSQQQLIDCSYKYGNSGCDGGWMPSALAYVKDQGLKSQTQYPYQAKVGTCEYHQGQYQIKQYSQASGCENLLSLLIRQPIIAGVDASNWSLYRGGILTTCGTTINHGVLVVGVTDEYWKIKNSWSQSWGQSGYIRISQGNTCGVCSYLSYPTL